MISSVEIALISATCYPNFTKALLFSAANPNPEITTSNPPLIDP